MKIRMKNKKCRESRFKFCANFEKQMENNI